MEEGKHDVEKYKGGKSLLSRVKEGLKSNKDLFIAGEILTSADSVWTETVDIYVAPIEPEYDASKLNKFMDSLVPEINRSEQYKVLHRGKDSDFSVGTLYFDEELGVKKQIIKTTVTAEQPDAVIRAGITIGKTTDVHEEKLQRRTWVRVYPDSKVARLAHEYESGVRNGEIEYDHKFNGLRYRISPEQLKILQESKSPFKKVMNLLRGRNLKGE